MQNILNRKRKGFTLIELIVVIAIIGILVLLAMPKFIDYTKEAKLTQIKHDVKVAETVIDEYLSTENKLPEGLEVPVMDTPLAEGRLFETRGVATAIIGDAAGYRDVTTMNEVLSIRSKLPGQFVANNYGKVYYIHDKAINIGDSGTESGEVLEDQPYSDAEIADLVAVGWIPVANADELNQIRQDGASLNFGAGTTWEGSYIAGHDKKYVQVADIDLSSYGVGYNIHDGEGWFPIGYWWDTDGNGTKEDVYFTGSYDGGKYTISNLYINRTMDYLGLFGQTKVGASFENIIINNAFVNAPNEYAGLLVGYLNDSYVENIKIDESSMKDITRGNTGLAFGYIDSSEINTVSINNGAIIIENEDPAWNIGMLAGYSFNSTITNVSTSGEFTFVNDNDASYIGGITGYTVDDNYSEVKSNVNILDGSNWSCSYVGGIAGYSDGSTIAKAVFSGDINTYHSEVGGIVGFGTYTTIKNAYSDGTITAKGTIGGIIGNIEDMIIIRNTHSVATISRQDGTTTSTGGIIGNIRNLPTDTYSFTIENNYYTGSYSDIGPYGIVPGEEVSAADMQNISTFVNWDFDTIWGINEKPYPTFKLGTEATGSLTEQEISAIIANLNMEIKTVNETSSDPADIEKIVFSAITKVSGIEYNEVEIDYLVSNFSEYVSANTATTLDVASNMLIEDIVLGTATVDIDTYVDWLKGWLLIYMQNEYAYTETTLLAGEYQSPRPYINDVDMSFQPVQFSDSFEIGHRYSYYYNGYLVRIKRTGATTVDIYLGDRLVETRQVTKLDSGVIDYVGVGMVDGDTFPSLVVGLDPYDSGILYTNLYIRPLPEYINDLYKTDGLYVNIAAASPVITDDSIPKVFVMHPPYSDDPNVEITSDGAVYNGTVNQFVSGFNGVDETDMLNKIRSTFKEELINPTRTLPLEVDNTIIWGITP